LDSDRIRSDDLQEMLLQVFGAEMFSLTANVLRLSKTIALLQF